MEQTTGLNRETWKVGWIFIDLGKRRRKETGLIFLRILKGPMYFGASLRDSTRRGRSRVESHTLCPGRNEGPTLLLRLACLRWSRAALTRAARALFQKSRQRRTSCVAAGTSTSGSCPGNRGGVGGIHTDIQRGTCLKKSGTECYERTQPRLIESSKWIGCQ